MKKHETGHPERLCLQVCWRACLIGCGLALFGLVVAVGWFSHESRLIRLIPGFVGVPYSTALGFLLSGLALIVAGACSRASPDATAPTGRHARMDLLSLILPGLVVLLGLLALVEWQTGVDLGLTSNSAAVRRWFVDSIPDRMSPLDAIGFIAIGLAIGLGSWAHSPRATVLAHGLSLLAIFVGFVGVIGDIAGLGNLLARYVGPVFLAGVGFLAAGFAVLALLHQRSRSRWGSEDADKIGLIAAAIMLITASSGIIGGFAALYPQAVGELQDNLAISLKGRSDALDTAIRQAWLDASNFANQPLRVKAMQGLDARVSHESAEIQAVAQQYKAFGFSGVVFRNAAGNEVARTGSFAGAPELAVAITAPGPSRLLWDGAFVLHTRVDMVSDGIVVGTLEAERRLAVGEALNDPGRFGNTLDFAVCAPAGPAAMNCFPFRSTAGKVLRNLPRNTGGEPIPAAYALAGQTGIVHTRDYRGASVIAAHQPIGSLGIGAVLKVDAEQLYSPIAQRLKLLLAGALVVGVAGTFLLRLQVLPLVRTLAEENKERRKAEHALRASEERYRSILQYSPTGILHYDNNLIATYCNDRFAQILQTRKENVIALDLKAFSDPRVVPALSMALDGKASTYEGAYISMLTGSTLWISLSCAPLHSLQGGIEGGIAIVEDITDRKQGEIALRQNEQRFRYMLETSPIAVRIAGLSGRKVLFANRGYIDLIESTADQVLGLDPRDYYVDPQDYEDILSRLSKGEVVTDTLVKLDIPGRTPKWALASYRSLEYENEPAVLGWFYDITDRRQVEEALREEQEKLRGLFDLSPLGICRANMDGRFIEFNEAFRNMTGYTEPELAVLDYWALTPKTYEEQEAAQLESLRETGRYGPYEKEYRRKDGSLVPIRLNGMIVTGADGQSYIWSIIEDITEHKKTEQQLERLARTDPLTGLSNRRDFMEIAEQEAARTMRSGDTLSFLMLDVDHFKHVNDTYGHQAGDAVLVRLGELCRLALRGYDTVGRVGGEEFAALLPKTSSEQALAVAQRMRSMIDEAEVPLENGTRLHFTVSIGVATLAGELANIETLQSQADHALYEAKRTGRNRVCGYQTS